MLLTILLFCLFSLVLLVLFHPLLKDIASYTVWRIHSQKRIQQGYVESYGATIHYQVVGLGPPLVLLHGGLSSSLDWYLVLPKLSKRFQLVLIDFRGHGRSTFGKKKLSYRSHAEDVIAALDVLKIAVTDVAGWSDGGITGLMLARDYPHRIKRIVAISANIDTDGLTDVAKRKIETSQTRPKITLGMLLYKIRSTEPERWAELWRTVAGSWLKPSGISMNELRGIEAKTLLVIGSRDDVSVEHTGAIASNIPLANIVVLDKVSHTVPQSARNSVVKLLTEFLLVN